jgi:hypothetical protein
MDTDWEDKFPMVSVRTVESIEGLLYRSHISTTGTPIPSFALQFKFEIGWLHREGFHDMVKTVWERPIVGRMPIQRWNKKLCATRKHFSGWARHTISILKKGKQRLLSIIDDLEALAEVRPLSMQEIELKSQSNAHIATLLREEELKWYQRSKAQFILEGDPNT